VLTYEHALVSPTNRAVVFSFLGTVVGAFGLVANLVIGKVADLWGVDRLYRLSAAFTFFAALSIIAARRAEWPASLRAATRQGGASQEEAG